MFAVSVAEWRRELAELPAAVDDGERVDRIRALEQLRSAVAAAQHAEMAAFDASQRTAQAAAGVRPAPSPAPAARRLRPPHSHQLGPRA